MTDRSVGKRRRNRRVPVGGTPLRGFRPTFDNLYKQRIGLKPPALSGVAQLERQYQIPR